jgi:hypothetical protein
VEVLLKVKLFSVTDVFPESQNFLELSEFVNGLHLLTFIEGQDDMFTLKSLGGNRGHVHVVHLLQLSPPFLLFKLQKIFSQALQAENDAIFYQQKI